MAVSPVGPASVPVRYRRARCLRISADRVGLGTCGRKARAPTSPPTDFPSYGLARRPAGQPRLPRGRLDFGLHAAMAARQPSPRSGNASNRAARPRRRSPARHPRGPSPTRRARRPALRERHPPNRLPSHRGRGGPRPEPTPATRRSPSCPGRFPRLGPRLRHDPRRTPRHRGARHDAGTRTGDLAGWTLPGTTVRGMGGRTDPVRGGPAVTAWPTGAGSRCSRGGHRRRRSRGPVCCRGPGRPGGRAGRGWRGTAPRKRSGQRCRPG